MNLFPSLPVLEELKKYINKGGDYRKFYIVSVQHLLETTGSLFEAIIDIGIQPDHIYLLGKPYSTHLPTRELLQEKGIHVFTNRRQEHFGTSRETLKKDVAFMWEAITPSLKKGNVVIILDDGGLAIRHAPNSLFDTCTFYAIEQTTFGLRYQKNRDYFPIIQVATSAAKKFLEPNLIASALIDKILSSLRKIKPKDIGVVGFGNIGKAVARKLCKRYNVWIYDTNPLVTQIEMGKLSSCKSLNELVERCDVIIGATGVDISKPDWDELITSDKTFISVSSGDIEFNTFIKRYNDQLTSNRFKTLDNIIIYLPSGITVTLLRGGTVANFNGSKESCPEKQIQLTRGLLLAGVLQAINNNLHISDSNGSFKLKPLFQKVIVEKWLTDNPAFKTFYPKQLLENFKDERWIEENSGGN
ncbi:MAG: NAD(P)-dependent oxidoreductase [Bacteroidota bacterium]